MTPIPMVRSLRAILPVALLLSVSACATKRDFRDFRAELETRARTDSVRSDARERALSDSLRVAQTAQADALFQFRGQVMGQLLAIQEQLVTIQELTGQNQRNVAELRDRLDEAREMLAGPPSGLPDLSGDGAPAAPAVRSGEGAEVYELALTQMNRGSRTTARRAFEEFLARFPSHPNVPDARYFLADLLVQEDRWQEAIEAFNQVVSLYPTSPRVPEALYRAGLAWLRLERPEEARDALGRVVTGYPESGAAVLAREALAGIR